jgi:hypothetical protein
MLKHPAFVLFVAVLVSAVISISLVFCAVSLLVRMFTPQEATTCVPCDMNQLTKKQCDFCHKIG